MRSLAFLLVSLLCLLSPPAAHAAVDTVFHYTSEAGDYIGKGQERTIRPSGGYTFNVNGSASSVTFYITGGPTSNYEFYSVDFAAPAGSTLKVGDYPGATRYPFQEGGEPGLDFDANGSGSNELTGQFQVLEITFDASGNLATFAADFVQHSEGGVAASYGQVRYNSSVPYLTPSGVAQLAASHYSVSETAGTLTVSATRRDGNTGPLSVQYATADGTDLAGRDYVATGGTLTWAAGDTANKTFTVPILNSGNPFQGNGTFLINLTGADTGAQTQATVTVINDNSSVTFVHFTSDAGDYIGQGQERTFSIANGYVLTASPSNGGVSFSFNNAASVDFQDSQYWTLDLSAAIGTIFGVGDYENAERAAFANGHPGLDLSGDGRGSNMITGNFQVLESVIDNGKVVKFAANFEQHSEGSAPGLYGQVRYNSSVPLPVMPTTVSIATTTTSITASSGTGTFLITRTGDLSQPLTVSYSVGGSAVNGQDYQMLKGQKKIKAGKSSVVLKVHPIYHGASFATRTVKLKIQPQAGGYAVVGTGKAKLKILEY